MNVFFFSLFFPGHHPTVFAAPKTAGVQEEEQSNRASSCRKKKKKRTSRLLIIRRPHGLRPQRVDDSDSLLKVPGIAISVGGDARSSSGAAVNSKVSAHASSAVGWTANARRKTGPGPAPVRGTAGA